MPIDRRRLAVPLVLAGAVVGIGPAWAADCSGPVAAKLTLGTVMPIQGGSARAFEIELSAGQGVYVDLTSLAPVAAGSDGGHDHHDGEDAGAVQAERPLVLCDDEAAVLVPQASEVFAKGGSLSAIPDGYRLRWVAPADGRYRIGIKADEDPRELLVRQRQLGPASALPVSETSLGRVEGGTVSSTAQRVFSFAGAAGQWIELKSVSEADTVLRLAGPDRAGLYSQIAENDDSEGLNPVIRRKLPVSGTYFVQVDSLGEDSREFTLTLKPIAAPAPPPPPAPLVIGTTVAGRLSGEADSRLYLLSVDAGHTYRIDLTAPYDGVVAIGLPNPVEPDDAGSAPSDGFAAIKQQDTGTSGTERLTFTARQGGQLLVQVRSFGIGDSSGGYSLSVTDLGG